MRISTLNLIYSTTYEIHDDMLAPHRVPPQMMGIVLGNAGAFGDVEKASKVFACNELIPLQKRWEELNYWLGEDVIKFNEYILD